MIRVTLIALLAAGLFSSWSGGIPLRPSEENALKGAVADFGDTSNAVAYRGLAHPLTDTRRYEKQVESGGMLCTDISEEAYFGPLTRKWLKKEDR